MFLAESMISSLEKKPAKNGMPHSAAVLMIHVDERDRHLAPDAAHVLLHVEAVVAGGVAHRAGAQEQAALEEGVGEDVEDGAVQAPTPRPIIM